MSHRTSLLLFACLFTIGACAKHEDAAATATAASVAPAPAPQELAYINVKKLVVAPASIHHDQPVTVTVELESAPAGTMLTLAWFDADGWLVTDALASLDGRSASFTFPAGTFRDPGHYRGSLRADVVHLADGHLDVTG